MLGLAAFSYLVWRYGIDQIALNIQKAGWSLLVVILIWFCIYILNTLAWKIILVNEISGVSFPRMFIIKVAGFTINTLTPFLAVGGEPFQVKVLGDLVGTNRSLSAVVLYRMIHLLGHMSLLFCGCICGLLFIPLPEPVKALFAFAAAVIAAIIYLTLSGHRNGIFVRLRTWTGKFGWLQSLWTRLIDRSTVLEEMDEVIMRAYANHRLKFILAVVCEFGSRLLMGVEVYVILQSIGIPITIPMAILLYVTYSIVINLLFFMPMNLGAREGGLILGLGSLAIPPMLGVYLSVVIRMREFFWLLFGLLFILFTMNWRTRIFGVVDDRQKVDF